MIYYVTFLHTFFSAVHLAVCCYNNRVRRRGRKLVDMTKLNMNKTLIHHLVYEHFCLNHVDFPMAMVSV